eukprot:CAMPEP_0176043554 /NCGR_PEP_ID=MMETSP0120_2-20121206/21614_1 /TAXON_ID=160619 /ORGANISM="Kryptoperidinium foliaceum, Strain CCMP 1326" /LENGTH=711 /DNA_ID=CAMNT_0017376961 /DNA_START=85 /DNA_END=2220 /DNA_ORIENTATION=-
MARPFARGVCGVLAACSCLRTASAADMNPLEKTIQLLTNLQTQVVADGEREQLAYSKYADWCSKTAKEKTQEVKSATKQKGKLEADIQMAKSDIEASVAKIEQLSALLATNDQKLKTITAERKEENESFKASEKQLMEAIDMLGRAIEILMKEAKKSSGALVQTTVDTDSLEDVLLGLGAVIDASWLTNGESQQLFSMLQARQDSVDGEEAGAPSAEAYKSQSGEVIEIMQDMREKAEVQLRNARDAEAKSKHNFNLLKQSLKKQTEQAQKNMNDEKSDKASAEESKATAEKNLAVTTRELEESDKALKSTQSTCIRTAADHEATMAGRKEELAVISKTKKVIQSSISGAAAFVQTAMTTATARRHRVSGNAALSKQVASMVKQLAAEDKSPALAQLASRLNSVVRYSSKSGEDPFAKVKSLITDMISKLTNEATAETREKEYCDREMGKTKGQKAELDDTVEGLKGKIDEAASASVMLKSEVKELQAELAELAKQQASMDDARRSSHEAYLTSKADLQQGLGGVRSAIRILREYYASDDSGDAALVQTDEESADASEQPAPPTKHEKSKGAGETIIGMLEVVESNFAKTMAEEETEEAGNDAEYQKTTQENKVLNAMRNKDVEYKTQEYKGLDKAITDMSADYDTATQELAAVKEYFGKLKERCVAKPESYEERRRRRQKELEGLKEAMSILEGSNGGSNAFLQRQRGAR